MSISRRLGATLHLLLYLAATGLQLTTAISHKEDHPRCYVSMVILVVLASVITNMTSLIWTYRVMDFTQTRSGEPVCVLMHVLQCGMFWRYMKVMIEDEGKDAREVHVLRLLQSSLQEAPFIIMYSATLFTHQHSWQDVTSAAAVATSALALTFVMTCWTASISSHMPSSTVKRNMAFTCFFIIHAFLLTSRFIALAVFTMIFKYITIIILALHLCAYLIAVSIIKRMQQTTKSSGYGRISRIILYGYVSLYNSVDFTCDSWIFAIYYVFIFLENLTMGLVWFVRTNKSMWDIILIASLSTCFMMGIAFTLFLLRLILNKSCMMCSNKLHATDNLSSAFSHQCDMPHNRSDIDMCDDLEIQASVADSGHSNPMSSEYLPNNSDRKSTRSVRSSRSTQDAINDLMSIDYLSDFGSRRPSIKSCQSVFIDPTSPILSPIISANISHAVQRPSHIHSDSGFLSHDLNTESRMAVDDSSSCSSSIDTINQIVGKRLENLLNEACIEAFTAKPIGGRPWDVELPGYLDMLDKRHSNTDLHNEYTLHKNKLTTTPEKYEYNTELSSSGCYADTTPSNSPVSLDRLIKYCSDKVSLSTPLTNPGVFATESSKVSPDANIRFGDISGSTSVTSYQSYSSTYDSCTTCRHSKRWTRRRLSSSSSSCTSDSLDTLDFVDSDLDYMTWPPRKVSIVNIADLPKEKITLQESISQWLNHLSEEPDDEANQDGCSASDFPRTRSASFNDMNKRQKVPIQDYMAQFRLRQQKKRNLVSDKPTKIWSKLCSVPRNPQQLNRQINTSIGSLPQDSMQDNNTKVVHTKAPSELSTRTCDARLFNKKKARLESNV